MIWRVMRAALLCGALSWVCIVSAKDAFATVKLVLPVRESELPDLIKCKNAKSEYCPACFGENGGNIALTQYSILRQALDIMHVDSDIDFVAEPNSPRGRIMLADGSATIRADWGAYKFLLASSLQSVPFILPGEIEKGIYTRPDSSWVLSGISNKSSTMFDGMIAVSSRRWLNDWELLQGLALRHVLNAPTIEQMFHLIHSGRADFTLLEFSPASDQGREVGGIRLFPLHGVKATFNDSRYFYISKNVPDAAKIMEKLNAGIKILRENGTIRRCLIGSSMINEQAKDWIDLRQWSVSKQEE